MRHTRAVNGFTLLELLVTVTIVLVLATLLLSSVTLAKKKAQRTNCLNSVKQISTAVHMFAEEHDDLLPLTNNSSVDAGFRYKRMLTEGNVGTASSSLWTCPADTFYYGIGYRERPLDDLPQSDGCSYALNVGNYYNASFPGLAGVRLAEVKNSSSVVLLCEAAAFQPFSWHEPIKNSTANFFNGARTMLAFVDGHADYVKMFWNGMSNSAAWHQDPPPTYDYRWSP